SFDFSFGWKANLAGLSAANYEELASKHRADASAGGANLSSNDGRGELGLRRIASCVCPLQELDDRQLPLPARACIQRFAVTAPYARLHLVSESVDVLFDTCQRIDAAFAAAHFLVTASVKVIAK